MFLLITPIRAHALHGYRVRQTPRRSRHGVGQIVITATQEFAMTLNMMLDNAVPEAIAGALTQQHPGLFFTMVEQASVAISLTDARANIIYANPAFCRQTDIRWRNCSIKTRACWPAARRREKSTRRCGKPCSSASRGAVS
jgi:PAS domain-containing protein